MKRRATTRTLLDEGDGSVVRRTTLGNGLRIVTEHVPGVRSVAVGAWIGVGSRDETTQQLGAAHFLEHLLFKGTARRSAWEISSAIEAVGGDMNAFTTKEYTCYYARVLDRDYRLAIDVVCDLISEGALTARDIEGERGVILEEIAMSEDDASDGVHELVMSAHFGDTPLGRPILGTIDSITALSARGIRGFYRGRYTPANIVIAVAGNVHHDAVVRAVRDSLPRFEEAEDSEPALAVARRLRRTGSIPVRVQHRPIEQANVVLAHTGLSRHDDRRYSLAVLNAALGGGMSSRLFQSIREDRGLAYSVYSFSTHYVDTGMVGVYAGCLPRKVDEVMSLARQTLVEVAESGLTDEELRRGRGQVTGQLVLGQEDTGARMSRIGKAELLHGRVPAMGEVLERIDAVTPEDVQTVASTLLREPPTVAVIGPVDEDHVVNLASGM